MANVVRFTKGSEKMKQTGPFIVAVVLGIVAGCANPGAAYRSKATLSPAEAGQYDVAFVIEDVSDPSNPSVISSPRIRLLKGKEGSVSVGDTRGRITCTAVVDDVSGRPEARTTVFVEKHGKMVWSATKAVAMSK
jgi:hypothetical protein